MKRFVVSVLAVAFMAPALAQVPPPDARPQAGLPPKLREVAFDQRLGEPVPLDAVFRDETGGTVRLGDYFGDRPVILIFAYYTCPMICHDVLTGVASSLAIIRLNAGEDFQVVTVSFDPRDTPERAAAAKEAYLGRYGRPETADGWHFLTGEPEAIEQLTRAAGFRYEWDPERQQFAHASGIMVATPTGCPKAGTIQHRRCADGSGPARSSHSVHS